MECKIAKVVLVTGGIRSGKSEFAERLVSDMSGDDVVYVAAGVACDEDMKNRIKIHKSRRNKLWKTVEKYKDIKNSDFLNCKAILLDSVDSMIANLMYEFCDDWDTVSREKITTIENTIIDEFKKVVKAAFYCSADLVMVTQEAGMSVIPADRMSRVFCDILGKVNQILAVRANEVYLISCGLPLKLK